MTEPRIDPPEAYDRIPPLCAGPEYWSDRQYYGCENCLFYGNRFGRTNMIPASGSPYCEHFYA